MKKLPLLIVMIFSPFQLAVLVWAQDRAGNPGGRTTRASVLEREEEPVASGRRRSGIKNRTFEISLANVSVNASNDFLTAKDIFRETATIYINHFLSGFRLNTSAAIKPLSLGLNWKEHWGFGLDLAHVDVFGNVSVSGRMINLNMAENEKFGVGAAAFVNVVGIPVFFHVNDFKIKIRPAAYFSLFYAEPGITYSFDGERLSVDYDMRIYTPISLAGTEGGDMGAFFRDELNAGNARNILKNNLGFDLSLGLEYPLYPWLDLGAEIANIPIPFAASKLSHYARFRDSVYVDAGKIDLGSMIGGDIPEGIYHVPEEFKPEYGYDSGGKAAYRPFAMLFYANYRPLNSRVLALIPSLGFSISRLYPSVGAIEGGVSVRCDLGNVFITTLGINYNDRKWKNSVDFALNLRAIELDFGVSVQSPDFLKSFQGAGLGVNFGVKLGW
ncbi:MAG: hypothetical protein LBQ69_01310 [Treponema sp.]|jgi:hypothetical protein|nr:hypothetical protein [Treponema sp.]